jgi:hypothetical protein
MEAVDLRKMAAATRLLGEQMSKLATERDEALSKLAEVTAEVAAYRHRDNAVKVACEMRAKGLLRDSFEDTVASLQQKTAADLERFAQGVDIAGPDMGAKLGSIHNSDGARAATSRLEHLLLSQV